MTIAGRRKRKMDRSITIKNEQVPVVENMKYLGVWLDPRLRFDEHFRRTRAKLYGRMCSIFNIADNVYTMQIRLIWEYCASTYICTKAHVDELQKFQNKYLRMALPAS